MIRFGEKKQIKQRKQIKNVKLFGTKVKKTPNNRFFCSLLESFAIYDISRHFA